MKIKIWKLVHDRVGMHSEVVYADHGDALAALKREREQVMRECNDSVKALWWRAWDELRIQFVTGEEWEWKIVEVEKEVVAPTPMPPRVWTVVQMNCSESGAYAYTWPYNSRENAQKEIDRKLKREAEALEDCGYVVEVRRFDDGAATMWINDKVTIDFRIQENPILSN